MYQLPAGTGDFDPELTLHFENSSASQGCTPPWVAIEAPRKRYSAILSHYYESSTPACDEIVTLRSFSLPYSKGIQVEPCASFVITAKNVGRVQQPHLDNACDGPALLPLSQNSHT